MKVVITHSDAQDQSAWVRELGQALAASRAGDGSPFVVAADGDPRVESADYAVGFNPPPDFFARHPRLRAFLTATAGVDRLLLHGRLPEALPILRLEDAGMGRQMIDYCRHEVLRIAGRFDEYQSLQSQGRWQELPALTRAELPIGVLGLGVLGTQVARAFAADGFAVNGYARSPRQIEGIRVFAGPKDWSAFLAATRVLIVLAPLTPDSADLLDLEAFRQLPRGSWLINVARGGLIVDADLVTALDEGSLAGATLDVFRQEPLPAQHPFWSHPAIRVTPHVSAVTLVPESAAQVADKLTRLERGEAASGWVERARGY